MYSAKNVIESKNIFCYIVALISQLKISSYANIYNNLKESRSHMQSLKRLT